LKKKIQTNMAISCQVGNANSYLNNITKIEKWRCLLSKNGCHGHYGYHDDSKHRWYNRVSIRRWRGEGAGAPSARTVMTNFIWRAEQWSATPQTYHFLPSVVSWMISFPVESASFFGGKAQLWKSVPFTLKMLCFVLS